MEKVELQDMVSRGLSLKLMSEETGKSIGTVRYWLKKYGLKTEYEPLLLNLDDVESAAKEATSFANMMMILGLSVHSSNYRRLRNFVSENSIDVSHFGSAGNKNAKRVSNEELFTKGHKHSFSTVRARVIQDGLVPRDRCAICGMQPIWNGKPLTFRLDHINGDHYDNRLSNLRFICANCDSQLDTYCHKNRKDTT
jgi:hypothetical protein